MHYIFKLQLLIALVLVISMPLVKTDNQIYQHELVPRNPVATNATATNAKATTSPTNNTKPAGPADAKHASADRPAVATYVVGLLSLLVFCVAICCGLVRLVNQRLHPRKERETCSGLRINEKTLSEICLPVALFVGNRIMYLYKLEPEQNISVERGTSLPPRRRGSASHEHAGKLFPTRRFATANNP
ncbi:hypothetical protein CROQUDRAFT_86196 [Cronartium quercuum f. sp. fusiforme G11]|uniref:Uncharacterized protein n=1 Tax=Cronartium quercuum f. sp. fusiforme G11 TaxID=708437 RepID=A0A9P6NRE3_9BASI|nr:hypothetical protein CROQUDRAFT_86196 [Cronartium quercuum f. sp. fusiforme G11]